MRGLSGRRPGAGIYQTGLFVMQQLSEVSDRDQPDPPGTEQTTDFASVVRDLYPGLKRERREKEEFLVLCLVML